MCTWIFLFLCYQPSYQFLRNSKKYCLQNTSTITSLPFLLTWRFYDEIFLAFSSSHLLCLSDHLLYFQSARTYKTCMIMSDIFNTSHTYFLLRRCYSTSILFSSTPTFRVFSLLSCSDTVLVLWSTFIMQWSATLTHTLLFSDNDFNFSMLASVLVLDYWYRKLAGKPLILIPIFTCLVMK